MPSMWLLYAGALGDAVSRVHPHSLMSSLPGGSDSSLAALSYPSCVYLGNAVAVLKPKHLVLGTLELPLQPLLLLLTDPAMMLELFQLRTQVLTLCGKWNGADWHTRNRENTSFL